MPQPQPWLPNLVRLPLQLAGAAPRHIIVGNTASPLLHQWARDCIFFSAPSAATTMHHTWNCDSRATASPSSCLRRASFFVHPAATTMAAPPRSRACLCRARKSPEPRPESPTTPAPTHLFSRLTLFLATSTMEPIIYSVQFHQHRSAANSAPPFLAREPETPPSRSRRCSSRSGTSTQICSRLCTSIFPQQPWIQPLRRFCRHHGNTVTFA